MKKITKKTMVLSVMSVLCAGTGIALTACGGSASGHIDVPQTVLEAELGVYASPDYEVIDEKGVILYGYNVFLKSVTNAEGETLEITYGTVTVEEAGIYEFVYSAGVKGIADVTVKIDFADRTAPTVNCDDSTLPDFYIPGNSYKIPMYTLSGDFVRDKCWVKVYHVLNGTETEVAISQSKFEITETSGTYLIRIHVEDAAGNANEYEYERIVDGPEHYEENKILYFDEAFGAKQVQCFESAYTAEFVQKDAEGAQVYGDENGALKVTFDGESDTRNGEGYLVMKTPAIVDVSDYEELYLWVYNGSEQNVLVGSTWWNDTPVKKGEWTKITWNTLNWGNNTTVTSTQVNVNDITNMNIRFMFLKGVGDDGSIDWGAGTNKPNGTFYLSSMYGKRKTESTVTAGEHVSLNREDGKYLYGDTVTLTAETIDGKTFDCFLVNGTPISGDTFTVGRESAYTVTVNYVDGELTADNMTWGQASTDGTWSENSDMRTIALGAGESWIIKYSVYGITDTETENYYFGAYIGGNTKLVGLELAQKWNSNKFASYGQPWDKNCADWRLNGEVMDILKGATEEEPVEVVFMRDGDRIKALLKTDDGYAVLGVADYEALELGNQNSFGIARRDGFKTPQYKSIEYISEASRFELFNAKLAVAVTKDDNTTTDRQAYLLGDKVTLTAAAPAEGKKFAYFTANGTRFEGNVYTVTGDVEFAAVYTDISALTLGDGVKLADGTAGSAEVAKDSEVTLVYIAGNTPSGKTFGGFVVDGTPIDGNTFTATGTAHTVTVKYDDKTATGSVAVNDVTKANDESNFARDEEHPDWSKYTATFDSSFKYDGADAAVTEAGTLKVTVDGNECSVALTDASLPANLDGYKEIYYYVYTDAKNAVAGGRWCGDTDLISGQWTKVSFNRSMNPGKITDSGAVENIADSVWGKGMSGFAYRLCVKWNSGGSIDNCVFYFTPVYGVPYDDVNVTVATANQANISVSAPANGSTYKEGETVTLSVTSNPAGKALKCFTANGTEIEGTTYTLGTEAVEFGAVFEDISEITLASGSNVATSDGETVYGRGATVTLMYNGSGNFDAFTVDGQSIAGNTFTATAAAHTVGVKLFTDASDMTWTAGDISDMYVAKASEGIKVQKFGKADEWAIRYTYTSLGGGDWGYNTGVYIGAAAMVFKLEVNGGKTTLQYGIYGGPIYDGAHSVENPAAIITALDASTEKPSTVTVLRKGNVIGAFVERDGVTYHIADYDLATYVAQAASSYIGHKEYTNDFGYFNRNGFSGANHYGEPAVTKIEYVATAKKVAALNKTINTVTVTTDANVTLDKAAYGFGDTVTLTAAPAASGMKFKCFTVDGKEIDGNTFVTAKSAYSVTAEYAEILTVTVGTDVTIAGATPAESGVYELARGVKITLVYNGSGNFDCFTVDGQPISGNTFTATAAAHTVGVKLFADASDMTWTSVKLNEMQTANVYSAATAYLTGIQSEYWIIEYDVVANIESAWIGAYVGESCYAEFEIASWGQYVHGHLPSTKDWTATNTDLTSDQVTALNNAGTANVTLKFIRNKNTLSVFFEDTKLVEYDLSNSDGSDFGATDFGVELRNGVNANVIGNIRFAEGKAKVQAYENSLQAD